MPINRQGSIRIFQVSGINVFLHWSWFLVALVEIGYLRNRYSSPVWSALEYLSLFLIVLLHEFGHALACRQVGGTVDRIMLWPLGGVAYVNPPQRPGAMLWSLAAGPLVNVLLLPVLGGAYLGAGALGWAQRMPDAYSWLGWVLFIDASLLVFNLLPVYPLDGGQILRSILWFFMGRARSLMVATVVGFVGAAGFVCVAIWMKSVWLIFVSAYMFMNCWSGWKLSQALLRMEKLPRRAEFTCPACRANPQFGPHWKCASCGQGFDTFATQAVCPHCGSRYSVTMCLDCQQSSPMSEWTSTGSYTGTVTPNNTPLVPQ